MVEFVVEPDIRYSLYEHSAWIVLETEYSFIDKGKECCFYCWLWLLYVFSAAVAD